MTLTHTTTCPSELDSTQIVAMHALMAENYHNVHLPVFAADLKEKNWVIELFDSNSGKLCGFSTLACYSFRIEDIDIRVAFSGDTIVSPPYWGSLQLPLAFGELMLAIRLEEPEIPLYWFLITKGHKTYRFLPVYFRSFYPRYDSTTPRWEKRLLDALAIAKFGSRYCPDIGIIEGGADAQSIRAELYKLANGNDRDDPHIDFFHRRNPNYLRGDELACIALFTPGNLRPYIRRQLERHRQ